MEVAHVHMLQPGVVEPIISLEVKRNGRFELVTDETGAFVIRFTGVAHAVEEIPLYIDSVVSVEVEVRLGVPEYVDDFSSVQVAGPFNDYSPTSMVRRPDDRLESVVESSESDVVYVLKGATETGWTHGTDSEQFEYHETYGYQSVLPSHDGVATIVFDPANLVRGTDSSVVRFRDPGTRVSRHNVIQRERRRRRRAYEQAQRAHLEGPDARTAFVYDWSAQVSSLEAQVVEEDDPVLRQALLLSLIECADLEAEVDPTIARRTLDEISPTSHMWSYAPWLVQTADYYAAQGDSTHEYRSFMNQVIESHPNRSVSASVLWLALWYADHGGDDELVQVYYQRLLEDHPESPQAEWAHATFSPDRNILLGKTIPEFLLNSLEDPELTYSRSDLEGKVYLIDFWATWCLPCVAELPNIDDAYEKYKDRGFDILSVACSDSRERVSEFRRVRWAMPWHHAIHELGDEAIKPFEVRSIPRAILVDRTGRIVGVDATIRGERLHSVLARVMEDGG
jgi:thiol-disulfide isomerase/thioredoxin